jgi:hypothetical protein
MATASVWPAARASAAHTPLTGLPIRPSDQPTPSNAEAASCTRSARLLVLRGRARLLAPLMGRSAQGASPPGSSVAACTVRGDSSHRRRVLRAWPTSAISPNHRVRRSSRAIGARPLERLRLSALSRAWRPHEIRTVENHSRTEPGPFSSRPVTPTPWTPARASKTPD